MSVQVELGLGSNVESLITDSWGSWAARQRTLARVRDPRRLREWLQRADAANADEVLYGLAWLASIDGADDRDCARVLAWLLVPGASFLARRLQTLSSEIDHMVAAELWVLVRTFPLHRRNVVRNLMWDLRTNVLAACEAPATLRRQDPVWYATLTGLDADTTVEQAAGHVPSSMEELLDVLDWACDRGVIPPADRGLLLSLVDAAQALSPRRGANQGVLANEATASAAAVLGVCDRTVRRRARRAIRALTAAASSYSPAA